MLTFSRVLGRPRARCFLQRSRQRSERRWRERARCLRHGIWQEIWSRPGHFTGALVHGKVASIDAHGDLVECPPSPPRKYLERRIALNAQALSGLSYFARNALIVWACSTKP